MGEQSMRKWMRRASDRTWREARRIQFSAPPSERPPPPVGAEVYAIALRMRRKHRWSRAMDRVHGLIARVIENRSAQIEANVRTNNALLARVLGPSSSAFWGRVRA